MAIARKYLLDLRNPGWVHGISRCVRKAFLAGNQAAHRKVWVEDRLRLLAEVFACEMAAYAVMSNHVHVVVRMAPEIAATWSAADVALRWMRIFPGRGRVLPDGTAVEPDPAQVGTRAQDAAWVVERRRRLADLPWFMKSLKEFIVRRANAEDGCTGAFWEERFTSVPLLDQAALIACMAYVDLNPIRAKLADRPERSTHTGAHERVRVRQRHRVAQRAAALPAPVRQVVLDQAGLTTGPGGAVATTAGASDVPAAPAATTFGAHPESGLWLTPMARCIAGEVLGNSKISVDDYLTLVDATGRLIKAGKRGAIPPELGPILARLDMSVDDWIATVTTGRSMLGGALGHAASRMAEAARRGADWVRNRCPLFAGKTMGDRTVAA